MQDGAGTQQAAPAAAGSATESDSASTSSSAAAPSSSSSSTSAQAPQLVSGQRVRVKKLARDMHSVKSDIVTTGPSPMQSDKVVGQYNNSLKRFSDALGRYVDYRNDPDVQAAAGAYKELVTAIKAEYQRAQGQLQQLGIELQGFPGLIVQSQQVIAENPAQQQTGSEEDNGGHSPGGTHGAKCITQGGRA